MSSLIKTIIVIAVLAGVGFVGYNYLSRDTSSPDVLQVQKDDPSQMGAQVLSALNQLQQLKLDESIFDNPAFKSLKDFSRSIPAEPIGRSNPFAPIGIDVGSVATNTLTVGTVVPSNSTSSPQKELLKTSQVSKPKPPTASENLPVGVQVSNN